MKFKISLKKINYAVKSLSNIGILIEKEKKGGGLLSCFLAESSRNRTRKCCDTLSGVASG